MSVKMIILFMAIGMCILSCTDEPASKTKQITIIKDTLQKSSDNSIVYNLTQVKELSRFTSMLTSAELLDVLQTPGPFTVFAPTNEAFENLPEAEKNKWNTPQKNELVNMLGYHISAGNMPSEALKNGVRLMSISGKELVITTNDNKILVNGKEVITHDIQSNNGVIHVIDGVIF